MNWYEKYIKNEYHRLGFDKEPQIDEPIIYGECSSADIFELLPEEYTNPNNNTVYKVRANLWDSKYRLTSPSEYRRFLRWHHEKFDYEKEFFDCDDAAWIMFGRMKKNMKGCANGLMITIKPSHAKNIVITTENGGLQAWEIEPQSGIMEKLYNKTMSQYFF